jgi:dolichol-phosphate mannosyltransferase
MLCAARIVLGLPAFNEAPNIDPLFARIAAVRAACMPNLSVLLYDDGSRDGTGDRARAWTARGLPVRVIGLAENRGLGTALWSLLADFAGPARGGQPGAAALALMDCDDTMDPLQLPRMWRLLDGHHRDLVIASRYRAGATISGVPLHRRVLSQGAGFLFKSLHPLRGVRDYSCGYRLYRRELLEQALAVWGRELVAQRGFASMVEVLLKLGRLGARCSEVPLQLNYQQKRGASKMAVSDNASRLLRLAWKWRREGLTAPAGAQREPADPSRSAAAGTPSRR